MYILVKFQSSTETIVVLKQINTNFIPSNSYRSTETIVVLKQL